MTENIDIVTREDGSQTVKKNFAQLGEQAVSTAGQIEILNTAIGTINGVLISAGIGVGVAKILQMAEAYQEVTNRLRLSSQSVEQYTEREQRLYDIAIKTRQAFDGVVSTFTTLDKATRALNLTDQERFSITETVAKAMTSSGKTADDVSSALKRLSLALQTGHADGRAFTSLFLQFPALGNAIANSMNLSAGAFRRMLESGEIGAKEITNALLKAGEAGSDLNRRFNQTEMTIRGAFTNIQSALERYIGQANQGAGVTRFIAEALNFLAERMNIVAPIVLTLTAALSVLLLIKAAVWIVTTAAAMGALALSILPVVLQVAAFIAVVVLLTLALAKVTDAVGLTDHVFDKLIGTLQGMPTRLKAIGVDIQKHVSDVSGMGKMWDQTSAGIDQSTKKIGKSVKDMSDSSNLELQIYQKGIESSQSFAKRLLEAMGSDVAAASMQINQAWSFAADDPNAGLKAYEQRMKEAQKVTEDVTLAIMKNSKQAAQAATGFLGETSAQLQKMGQQMNRTGEGYITTQNAMTMGIVAGAGAVNNAYEEMASASEKFATRTENSASRAVDAIASVSKANTDFAGGGFSGQLGDVQVSDPAKKAYMVQHGYNPYSLYDVFKFEEFVRKGQLPPDNRRGGGDPMFNFANGGSFIVGGASADHPVTIGAGAGERVTVETPQQQRAARVTMIVNTPDANSFQASQRQLTRKLAISLQRVAPRANNPV